MTNLLFVRVILSVVRFKRSYELDTALYKTYHQLYGGPRVVITIIITPVPQGVSQWPFHFVVDIEEGTEYVMRIANRVIK